MNVLFFTHEKEYGGASRALVTLIEDLKQDHHIYVVVPFKNAKIVSGLKKQNVEIITCFYGWWQVPTNISFLQKLLFRILYLFNFFSVFYLTRKIKKLNIDIIHSNTSVIDIGAKVANKLNILHVWHFREFTGKHLTFVRGEKKSYQFINTYAQHIIYISKAIRSFYEKNITKGLGKLIYDGVSEDFVLHKKYGTTKKKITFLLVATLEKNKGQEVAVRAVYELKKKGITNFKLLLVGGDPTGYYHELTQLIQKFSIDDLVEYGGFVQDMKSLRRSVDVELMCAPAEAFGLVTVEAMLAGNPVIGSNSGATSELISDGETGYLYQLNHSEELANKMEKIIKDPKLIEVLGKKAQKEALKNFSSKSNSTFINKLYIRLLKEKKL